jgi:KDO2-lipid IV(A) lauroyltransferase
MAAPGFIAKWTQYFLARMAAFGLSVADVDTNLRAMEVAGRIAYHVDRRHRQRLLENLGRAFPHLPHEQLEMLGVGAFEHLMKLLVEIAVTPRLLHADTWPRRVIFTDMARTMQHLNAGEPAIVLTGHVGNWEILGYVNALMGYPVDAIARPIDNPLVDRWIKQVREQRGLRLITKWDATDRMVSTLQRGGLLGFVADQNAGAKGIFVPFFNRLASTYKSIGLLAIQMNVPVICGFARRTGSGFHYEIRMMDYIDPADWADKRDPLYYVTARYMHAIEQMVRIAPQQYLWMHRRWKTRPKWETEGKPMPAGLRQNLEELPWMNEQLMRRLETK